MTKLKKIKVLIVSFIMILSLAACAPKSGEDVANKLSKKLEDIETYKISAVMTTSKNNDEQTYNIDVLYQKPDNYKVTLSQEDSDYKQIIVKNEEGVYVMTPKFNKTVKFSSDWPLNSSNFYMIESLLKDMLSTEDLQFKKEGNDFVVEGKVTSEYDPAIASQKIVIDKDSMLPKKVFVYDETGSVIVTVDFTSVSLNEKIDSSEFDIEVAMDSAREDIDNTDTEEDETTFSYPTYLPDGAVYEASSETSERLIITFSGDKSFTVIQDYASVRAVFQEESSVGDLVFVAGVYGEIKDDALNFIKDGVEYNISGDNLERDELINIGESMTESGK